MLTKIAVFNKADKNLVSTEKIDEMFASEINEIDATQGKKEGINADRNEEEESLIPKVNVEEQAIESKKPGIMFYLN